MIPDGTPAHEDIIIDKEQMPSFSDEFQRIPDFLGDKKDSIAQYRGPNNIHILEYETYWSVHWDWGDPRTIPGAIVHIFADDPDVGLSLLIAAGAAKATYDKTKSPHEHYWYSVLWPLVPIILQRASENCSPFLQNG
ncbi:MAG: hypothetical protein GF411_18535 [Candidatus Lokiarchaeota archaeon]|nr:hypothetical protein [Candidatus Lokiarchaeota archaeon]